MVGVSHPSPRVAVGHQQDRFGLGNRQRPQEDGIDDGEGDGVGRDTNGQRRNDGCSPAHRDLFEKGVRLSALSRKQLEQAEAKVEILLKKERKVEAAPFELDDGEPDA